MSTAAQAAAEFPFMGELSKREKTRRMKLLEVCEQLEARTKEKGPVIPQTLAAEIVGVSRQRIGELVDQGRIESFKINGTRFVFLQSFREFLKEERPVGIQRGPYKAAFLAGMHLGKALAAASEGDGDD